MTKKNKPITQRTQRKSRRTITRAKILKKLPKKYIPKHLSRQDKKKWADEIQRSKQYYKRGEYYVRKPVKTYKHKKSSHIDNALKIYNMVSLFDNTKKEPLHTLSKKSGCSVETLQKIINKGAGAYYSSGSRPNQTPQSWGIARLASAITGGKSSYIDRHELLEGCSKNSKALKLMMKKRPRKTQKRRIPK